jgi:cobyrinic acid a,c-diamide synthase
MYAADLAANEPLLADVRGRVGDAGLPTWAECGGLLWLCGELDGHRMAGVVPARARMTERLTLGYRQATLAQASPVGTAGATFRGHEFHYSVLDPPGDALLLSSRFGEGPEGWATPTCLATYVHHHPGGDPGPVERFVATCARPALPVSHSAG